MSKSMKSIKEIMEELLVPAFDLIREHIVSTGHRDPEITTKKDRLKLSFVGKGQGKRKWSYVWQAKENGRIYQFYVSPDLRGNDEAGCDAAKATPQMILEDFKRIFRTVL